MSTWIRVLLVVSLFAGCQQTAPARVEAPADTAAGEIGFSWAGPSEAALIVPVHINGTGPHDFVLDTGAMITCVSDDVASELSLPDAVGQIGFGAGVGGPGRLGMVEIDSLRVGAGRAEELSACVLDLGATEVLGLEIDGLLGLNFLRPFRLIIDFERQVLILHEP